MLCNKKNPPSPGHLTQRDERLLPRYHSSIIPCSEYRCILCNHNPQNSSGISLWIQSYPRCCNGSTRLRLFCIAITYFSTASCRQSHALYIFSTSALQRVRHFHNFMPCTIRHFSESVSPIYYSASLRLNTFIIAHDYE